MLYQRADGRIEVVGKLCEQRKASAFDDTVIHVVLASEDVVHISRILAVEAGYARTHFVLHQRNVRRHSHAIAGPAFMDLRSGETSGGFESVRIRPLRDE